MAAENHRSLDSDERRRSSRRRHHSGSSRRKTVYILYALLSLAVLLIGGLVIKIVTLDQEVDDWALINGKLSKELEKLKPELEKAKAEVKELTHGRLPYLMPIEFDKVLTIDDAYVKNIAFSLSGTDRNKLYEYKIVAQNSSLSAIHPRIDVAFFDRVGIQIGESKVGLRPDGTPTLDMLDRGEIRSFSSTIIVAGEEKPEYFLVRIRPE